MSAKAQPAFRIRDTIENRMHRRFEPEYRHTAAAATVLAERLAATYRVPVVVDWRDLTLQGKKRAWRPTGVRCVPEVEQ